MLKLVLIFLIGIAYAAQTRVKIGSKSWAYRIELNQEQNIRTEFSDDQGVAIGSYVYQFGNQTKMLQYRIDPNHQEPDISFNVTTIDNGSRPKAATEPMETMLRMMSKSDNGTTTASNSNSNSNSTKKDNEPSTNSTMSGKGANDTQSGGGGGGGMFESIDSNQEFRGHVTFKVGNVTYNINFVTGDKSNTREETLTTMGVLYGRFNYLLRSSPTKVVINYKFNSSSSDPTFEVSLFKSSETEVLSPNNLPYTSSSPYNRMPYHRSGSPYNADRSIDRSGRPSPMHHSSHPYNTPTSSHSSSSPSDRYSSPSQATPDRRAQSDEKYRSNSVVNPNWYHNRVKVYDP